MKGETIEWAPGFWNVEIVDEETAGGDEKENKNHKGEGNDDEDGEDEEEDDEEDDEDDEETAAQAQDDEEEDDDDDEDLELDFSTEMDMSEINKVFSADKDDAQDDQDKDIEIFDTFGGYNFAPRITEADTNNDRTSLNRKLDERLYLLIMDTATNQYRFPTKTMNPTKHATITASDTQPIMKKYAMQSIKEDVGMHMYKYMVPQLNGAPIGFDWTVNEEGQGDEYYGTKNYYFKAQCYDRYGEEWPEIVTKGGDYVWVTKDEIVDYLEDNENLKHVKHLL